MLDIKRINKVSNKNAYKTVGRDKLKRQVEHRQLRFVGHCLRRNEKDPICKYVLRAPGERHGKRSVGRPHTLYHQYIGKLINSDTPPTVNEMRYVARSDTPDHARNEWKKFVTDLTQAQFDVD
jgi:hypothetical protein